MAAKSLDRLLTQLEECRYRFGRGEGAPVIALLRTLQKAIFRDAKSLIRFHEALLFLRAFPQSAAVLLRTETLLNSFHRRVDALRQSGADMSAFDPLEVSGIAGTQMSDTLSFDVARWLVRRTGVSALDRRRTRVSNTQVHVEIEWDEWDEGRAMASTLPRFLPLLDDDAFVEADTPWRRWIEAASGLVSGRRFSDAVRVSFRAAPSGTALRMMSARWLIQHFQALPISDRQRAELYDSLRVPMRWELGASRMSRTRNWVAMRDAASRVSPTRPRQKVFYHDGPLIPRGAVSLEEELAKQPPKLVKLSPREGERIIDMIREVMLVRYRELYGTTLGDPASVRRAEIGRGMSVYFWNLPPERRLPLRAYTAGFTLKNGVPINYIEAIGLCEWMEVGFNTFYTFRGGEAGWIYAQVLRCLTHLMGTTCVSVYPYQLGHDNDEAIESGAFWFYRKLGFRPGRADLLRLVEQEEKKIAASRKNGTAAPAPQPYRTPARILRRLASGHVFYELPGSEVGAWDSFSTRNIGLLVTARMTQEFNGDADRMREAASRSVARILKVNTSSWPRTDQASFENSALMLDLISDLSFWTSDEKDALVQIIRAKTRPDEMLYLELTQQHGRLRKAFLRFGRESQE